MRKSAFVAFAQDMWRVWWASMSCALFTFLAVFAALRGGDQAQLTVVGTGTIALVLFVVAAFRAWKFQYDAKCLAEEKLSSQVPDIYGYWSGVHLDTNPGAFRIPFYLCCKNTRVSILAMRVEVTDESGTCECVEEPTATLGRDLILEQLVGFSGNIRTKTEDGVIFAKNIRVWAIDALGCPHELDNKGTTFPAFNALGS